MIKLRPGFLIAVVLACAPSCTFAQGTSQQNGVRSGYGSTSSPGTTSQGSTNSPSGTASRNSTGSGQGRSEGALGLTPQLQKELGIKQQ
jgi:hypothetical protein